MKTRDFYFDLPDELIAQYPTGERGQSRLLVYRRQTGEIIHGRVQDLATWLAPGTCMVFNNTRVRKARIHGLSPAGGRFELVLLRQRPVADWPAGSAWECMARKSARLKPGTVLEFPEGLRATILAEGSQPGIKLVGFAPAPDAGWLERHGHIPLPPYIRREDLPQDASRYQTVYAGPEGSAAAPTAGLHFTPELLAGLEDQGMQRVEVTLHVGLGTFMPVRAEDIQDHRMHEEDWSIPEDSARAVNQARQSGRPVLAVGTTSARTLESAGNDQGLVAAGSGSTRIFMYPGYRFKVVDALFTNFHTPESTLLMLVSAFAGREEILRVYAEAIQERYRFFSYGDAMLIL